MYELLVCAAPELCSIASTLGEWHRRVQWSMLFVPITSARTSAGRSVFVGRFRAGEASEVPPVLQQAVRHQVEGLVPGGFLESARFA